MHSFANAQHGMQVSTLLPLTPCTSTALAHPLLRTRTSHRSSVTTARPQSRLTAQPHLRPSVVSPPTCRDVDFCASSPDEDIAVDGRSAEAFPLVRHRPLDEMWVLSSRVLVAIVHFSPHPSCLMACALYSPPPEPVKPISAPPPVAPLNIRHPLLVSPPSPPPVSASSSFSVRGHSSSSVSSRASFASAPRTKVSTSLPKLQRGNTRHQQNQVPPRIAALGAGFVGVTGTRVMLQEKGRP